MDNLKETIAQNLIKLRTQAKLTQLQLAEMLNYSDKAVSKWERGESIPDLRVLMQIAEIYNIKLDDLVHPMQEEKIKPTLNVGKKRLLITLLSVGLVWFIATGIFAVLYFIPQTADYAYLVFLAAPFASAIVLTVFSSMWGNRFYTAFACSLLVWMLALLLATYLQAFNVTEKYWLFFIVTIPFQVLIILWFVLRKVK
ncbi:MAG: helix-turn-helix transcriptional regulator [Clostridiales bacterium]|nr:helix-turn-helix transcriptional regulator [Clostridiales bacterium]